MGGGNERGEVEEGCIMAVGGMDPRRGLGHRAAGKRTFACDLISLSSLFSSMMSLSRLAQNLRRLLSRSALALSIAFSSELIEGPRVYTVQQSTVLPGAVGSTP